MMVWYMAVDKSCPIKWQVRLKGERITGRGRMCENSQEDGQSEKQPWMILIVASMMTHLYHCHVIG